jgi:hypothetical protein
MDLNQHAVRIVLSIKVKPDHLALVVDPVGHGHRCRPLHSIRIVDCGVGVLALIVQKAVRSARAVSIRPHDLALVIDTQSLHRYRAARTVEPNDLLALQHEADIVVVSSDYEAGDVALIVDGRCLGARETSYIDLGKLVVFDIVGEAMVVSSGVRPEGNRPVVVVHTKELLRGQPVGRLTQGRLGLPHR